MHTTKLKIGFVGDVLTRPFGRLAEDIPEIQFEFFHYDIDQHFQLLHSEVHLDVLILHAGLSFYYKDSTDETALNVGAAYRQAVRDFCVKNNTLVILNTVVQPSDRMIGLVHLKNICAVAQINQAMCELANEDNRVVLADVASAINKIGSDRAINQQNELVMRMPYTGYVLPLIIKEYARVVREKFLPRKKALVLDADNTLWGGIVGEDGVDGLQIHTDYPGIVYRRFQEQLLALKRTGILLALVSKNNEADVLEVFDRCDMPLKFADFSAVRINWVVKSENIRSIAEQLNIGIDSFVFIDDNSFELEEVRQAFPQISVYQFNGRKPQSALSLLPSIPDLGAWSVTTEDLEKATLYRQESQRQSLQKASRTLDDYLASLGIILKVGCNRTREVQRISQLINKTNQFNLTTQRYSEAEVREFMRWGKVYDFRVVDNFGDMGIVGVVIIKDREIDTFLMSCRALGRRVETTMLSYVCDESLDLNLTSKYVGTGKNSMVHNFYDTNGFELLSDDGTIKRYRRQGIINAGTNITIEKVLD